MVIIAASSLFVRDRRGLDSLVAQLRAALATDARLAFDTEFIRERTYAPVLEIIQIAVLPPDSNGEPLIAVVDVPALSGDLGGLGELLLDPAFLKIVHAGGQDIEILTSLLGAMPTPVFDTQVAAAFAGYSLQTGYGALVQALLGVRLAKDEGFADWSRRPLTPAMLDYAENDVRFLHELHDRLAANLEKRGRTAWAEEQTVRILSSAAEETPRAELWRRVSGKNYLDDRGLAVLRELAVWRDDEAQRRDKPRRTVAKDDALIEIAKRLPQSGPEVLALRGAPQNLGERAAAQIAERVKLGLAVPKGERPHLESLPPLDDQGAVLVELLAAVVRARAMEVSLPPSLLAGSDDLRALAVAVRRKDQKSLFRGPLFEGWRGEIIGGDLQAVVEGTLAVAWDPQSSRLRLTPREVK